MSCNISATMSLKWDPIIYFLPFSYTKTQFQAMFLV